MRVGMQKPTQQRQARAPAAQRLSGINTASAEERTTPKHPTRNRNITSRDVADVLKMIIM